MQKLTRRQLTQIVTLITQRKARVKWSDFWAALTADLGIAESSADGRAIKFSASDREVLRQAVLQQEGFDPLVDVLPAAKASNRLEMAGMVSNEKLAYAAVSRERLMVAAPHGEISVNGVVCVVPKETGLWVDWRTIELLPQQSLIIVENKLAFINWHLCKLPGELNGAVVVYRGDNIEARALSNWLEALSADRVIGAYDFDPAGLAMARQQGVGSILVPVEPDRFLQQQNGALHKPDAFAAQHRQHESNRQWVCGDLELVWHWMERNGTSITQEAMLVAGEPLRAVRM